MSERICNRHEPIPHNGQDRNYHLQRVLGYLDHVAEYLDNDNPSKLSAHDRATILEQHAEQYIAQLGWRANLAPSDIVKMLNKACGVLEHGACTICTAEPSPGFYTGCVLRDQAEQVKSDWTCDGKGRLLRPRDR
jgi:hypothetical protein